MLKLMKFLKPYWAIMLCIVALVCAQVYTELKLPDLMSDIINNGVAKTTYEFNSEAFVKALQNGDLPEFEVILAHMGVPPETMDDTQAMTEIAEEFAQGMRDDAPKDSKGFDPEALKMMAPLMEHNIVNAEISPDIDYIWHTGGLMLLYSLAGVLAVILLVFFTSRISMAMGRDLGQKIFSHVSKFSLGEFDKIGTASLITRTTNDVNQIKQMMVFLLRFILFAPLMCIYGIIMAYNKDTQLSLVFVAIIPILIIIIGVVASITIPQFKTMQVRLDNLSRVLRERLMGIRVIRAYNKTAYEQKRFDDKNIDLTDVSIKVNRVMAFMMPIMMLTINFTTLSIMWFGAKRVETNHMQIGDLMAFTQYAVQILFAFMMMSMIFIMIPRASASAVRINEILETQPAMKDSPHRGDYQSPAETQPAGATIEFKNVVFKYPGSQEPALNNISLTALPGQTTAIIGGTGSGKSTLCNLIPRFYDIESGEILIDGVNIADMPLENLRALTGCVPQKAVLFSGTVSENIRTGREDATDDEIIEALKIAQGYDFVMEKPDGLHEYIAQGGTNMSGGQKQRLCIARALVRKPQIYIFDDSFSALDFKTDAALRKALKEQTGGSTVLIVAQRVATIMNAENIIVLDDGEIVGQGTHKELFESCGVYRELVLSQLSQEEVAQ